MISWATDGVQLKLDLEWTEVLGTCAACGKEITDPGEWDIRHSIGWDDLCDRCCPCERLPMHHPAYGHIDEHQSLAELLEAFPDIKALTGRNRK